MSNEVRFQTIWAIKNLIDTGAQSKISDFLRSRGEIFVQDGINLDEYDNIPLDFEHFEGKKQDVLRKYGLSNSKKSKIMHHIYKYRVDFVLDEIFYPRLYLMSCARSTMFISFIDM